MKSNREGTLLDLEEGPQQMPLGLRKKGPFSPGFLSLATKKAKSDLLTV